ncbi:MAG: NrpR regulatory domain-containing protein [Thermoleophilia bacterium]|nr:NrpR regulatory domain-containing protein [Thermoleophilia bacterium]
MKEKIEEKRLAILRLLRDAQGPLGSSKIAERLEAMGHETSERTVRFHLLEMDKAGLTRNLGRKGRVITERGLAAIENAHPYERVGFLSAKIDQMTYRMSFDLTTRTGTVVVNLTLIEPSLLDRAVPLIQSVFEAGYSMGKLVTLFAPGEQVGMTTVPEGYVGIGTVCSITLNGVLVSHGIPTHSRFGGLLELRDHKPTRFTEFIHYDGTTIDPLEIFIRGAMTDYVGATRTGNGLIGASFREVPGDSRDHVLELAERMDRVGLGGVFLVGWPGRPLLEVPVSEGRLGVVVIGGLNPVAILEEVGIKLHRVGALTGLVDYGRLFPYQELGERAREILTG